MPQTPTNTPADALAKFWKQRYQKQKFLIGSITSLLAKYGNSTNIENLRSTFVLSLMGHYVTGEACYYHADPRGDAMVPVLSYGRVTLDDLPAIDSGGPLARVLLRDRSPRLVSSVSRGALHGNLAVLADNFKVISPLYLKERLIGVVFLGEKVLHQGYNDFDLEVMDALCAASATTFNNAALYRNARLATKEIQRLFDLRSEVISRITHEFRTPLTVIRGGIEPLQNDSNYARMHSWLLPAVDRLGDLIDDLLRLSAERRDVGDTAFQGYDPMPTIQSASIDGARCRGAAARGAEVSIHRDASAEDIWIGIGRRDLAFVVRAMVENAVTFGRKGTGVTVDIGTRTGDAGDPGIRLPDWEAHTRSLIDEYMHEGVAPTGPRETSLPGVCTWFTIAVTDAGIGIPAGEVEMIAEPFRQASNNPARGVRGKGLGLALVHKIVTQNGGHVYCQSVEGQGSTFTVMLPAV